MLTKIRRAGWPAGSAADGPVTLTADARGATISIEPQPLPPGVVGEVSVVPRPATAEEPLVVTITATRGAIERRQERVLTMVPGESSIGPEAAILLGRFTAWLAAERPELGIGPETAVGGHAWQLGPGRESLPLLLRGLGGRPRLARDDRAERLGADLPARTMDTDAAHHGVRDLVGHRRASTARDRAARQRVALSRRPESPPPANGSSHGGRTGPSAPCLPALSPDDPLADDLDVTRAG